MSKSAYVGIEGLARKVKKIFVGVDGVARKVKKGYVGLNGVAKQFFSSGTLVTHPTVALTADSSNGYVASASSTNSSSYAAYKAFNKGYGDRYGWVSKARSTDSSPYIQLKLPSAQKIVGINIANRTFSYVNGIIDATILGSTNGSSWVTICEISGRAGGTTGLLTEHECIDTGEMYQYVRIKPTNWNNRTADSGNSYVSIGEIYIICLEE